MKQYSPAYAPIASVFLIMLANGFFTTFLSLRLNLESQSVNLVGWLGAVYFTGMLLGGMRVHVLVKRIGHIRAFAAFASVLSATMIAKSLYYESVLWLALRFLGGFCCAGLFVVAESWLVLLGTAKTRGKLLSLYMISLYGGQGIGQLLLSYLDPLTFYPFSIAAMLACLSTLPVCLMREKAPEILQTSLLNIRQLYKISPLGLIGAVAAGFLLGPCYSLMPVWLQEQQVSSFFVAYAMSGIILGGLLFQWPIGWFSDLFERRRVLGAIALITAGLSLLLVLATPSSPYLLFLLLVLWGGFLFTLYPVSITISSDHFDGDGDLVALMGGLIVAFGVGSIIGPLIAPVFMESLPQTGFFLYMVIVSSSLSVYAFWRRTQTPDVPQDERVPYMPVPRTTAAGAALDPRVDEVRCSDPDCYPNSLKQSFLDSLA